MEIGIGLPAAVPGVAFNYPGTEIGEASVTERDKIAADHDAATIELLRDRLRATSLRFSQNVRPMRAITPAVVSTARM